MSMWDEPFNTVLNEMPVVSHSSRFSKSTNMLIKGWNFARKRGLHHLHSFLTFWPTWNQRTQRMSVRKLRWSNILQELHTPLGLKVQVLTPKFSLGGPKSDSIMQTMSTLMSFVLVMLLYPEVQMKVQKELDAVIATVVRCAHAGIGQTPMSQCGQVRKWSNSLLKQHVVSVMVKTGFYLLIPGGFTHCRSPLTFSTCP